MQRPASTDEASGFLAAQPDIEAIQLVITDPNGVGRGKTISREELAPLYATGRCVAGSILGLDVTGQDVEETGLVWSVGDADGLCRPVPGTLVRASWLSRPTAQVLLSMYETSGTPAAADPRHALARVLERFAADGLRPVVAAELEFYLLVKDADGRVRPACAPARPADSDRIDAYGLGKLESLAPVFDAIYQAAAIQGLPARTLMAEYAPGQFEITLAHRTDALRAIDEAILLKRLIRGVAARYGLIACFMAKPFAERAGTGLHLHASLADADGNNLCASEDPRGSELLRQAIGGLKATMAESMLVFAPHANSYRRFRRLSYAPTAPTWGVNNRSVSLRVPAGPPASRHVEHRVSGADANPYLVAATVLAGMHLGVRERLDPGEPLSGNAYLEPATESLPTDWRDAIERAETSGFLRDSLGGEFMRVLLAIKWHELERFQARVSEVDYDWYLETV